MNLLEHTLPTPPENLALDEALLQQAADLGDTLRIWCPPGPAVIVGRASRVAEEVDLDVCRQEGVPVLRRCSGGAAVLISPGCLMYSVVLSTEVRPELSVVDNAHQFVLQRVQQALLDAGVAVEMAGLSDLVWRGRKFSGNSLRCVRQAILYHGTLLVTADIPQIQRCLRMPPRQPDYRQRRTHEEFLINLPVDLAALRQALAVRFGADRALSDWPRRLTEALVEQRYATDEWNRQR